MKRVVVTGVGVIATNGLSTETFWRNCLDDVAIVASIPAHWQHYTDYKSTLWAPLPDLDYQQLGFNRMEIMQRDPVALLATAAASQAVDNAGLATELLNKRKNNRAIQQLDNTRAGVYIGTGSGGYSTLLQNHTHHLLHRPSQALLQLAEQAGGDVCQKLPAIIQQFDMPARFNPFGVPMSMVNAVSAGIGIKFNLHGPNHTITQACASGSVAIGLAFHAIQTGVVDFALSGGCEFISAADGGEFRGFDVAKTLVRNCDPAHAANRPFDQDRSGFLFAQGGAACLTLESLAHAQQRKAPILAELVGFAETFDADSLLSLDPNGAQIERMLGELLRQANIQADQVDYINAHGTGTQVNDSIESDIIERFFPHGPRVNSTKSLIGHAFGASGALEAAVCLLSIRDQTTHVCHNLENPIAALNFVRERQTERIDYALSESFAFGGHNVSLLFKRFA